MKGQKILEYFQELKKLCNEKKNVDLTDKDIIRLTDIVLSAVSSIIFDRASAITDNEVLPIIKPKPVPTHAKRRRR